LREGARGRGPLPPPSNSLPQPLEGSPEAGLRPTFRAQNEK